MRRFRKASCRWRQGRSRNADQCVFSLLCWLTCDTLLGDDDTASPFGTNPQAFCAGSKRSGDVPCAKVQPLLRPPAQVQRPYSSAATLIQRRLPHRHMPVPDLNAVQQRAAPFSGPRPGSPGCAGIGRNRTAAWTRSLRHWSAGTLWRGSSTALPWRSCTCAAHRHQAGSPTSSAHILSMADLRW